MIDALDLNWSVRMSEVQVKGDPSCMELRKTCSDCGYAIPATASTIRTDKVLSLFHFGPTQRILGSGLPSPRFAVASILLQSCHDRRTKLGRTAVSEQAAEVAGFCPSTDIFEESSNALTGAWSFSRLIVSRCAHSSDSRARDSKLRCPIARERGLRLCR